MACAPLVGGGVADARADEHERAPAVIRGCGRFLGDSHAAIPWL